MTYALRSLTSGELRPANVAELEAELSALWRSAGEDPKIGQAVTRACALTLLVYVESEEAGREVSNLISQVTAQNPCRAVVMIARPEATPARLTAWVSAHCHLPAAGEKLVCCEQVSVLACGDAARDLDNMVLPLAVPGLPVFLWWRAGRFAPPNYFDQILRISNRVLVDSAGFPDPDHDLSSLAGHAGRFSGKIAFGDLNWIRLTPWRELIAQCFDSTETRPYLECLTQVRIEQERRAGEGISRRTESLLLTAWLASRLKWETIEQPEKPIAKTRPFRFKSRQGEVEVELVPLETEGGEIGSFVSVILKAAGTSTGTFSLRSGPNGETALTRSEIFGRPPIERTVRLEVPDEAGLVNEELKYAGRDLVYEETLGMAARMLAR